MKKLLFVFLLSISLLYANNCETDIYFGNGVWNTKEDARISLEALEAKIKAQSLDNNRNLNYKLAYNSTETAMLDLVETFFQLKQAGQIGNVGFNVMVSMLVQLEHLDTPFVTLKDQFQDDLLMADLIEGDNVATMLVKYNAESFNQKHRVLLLSHSQGNLFGNRIFNKLTPSQKDRFKMISVGTPANNVAGSTAPYTTLHGDYVIQPLQAFGALSSNTNGVGHEFVPNYLGNDESYNQIISHIGSALENLDDVPCSNYDSYLWVGYDCTRQGSGLNNIVDIFGVYKISLGSSKVELVYKDSSTSGLTTESGICEYTQDDILSYQSSYDKNGCEAYFLTTTSQNSKTLDDIAAKTYYNPYNCTKYHMTQSTKQYLEQLK